MKTVSTFGDASCGGYRDAVTATMSRKTLYIAQQLIINGKFASNSVHNHPNSILSGVYYLKAPENCGGIYFNDPRPASQMLIPPVTDFNLWTHPKVSYKPNVGTMLLFPSWLLHGVDMNMSDEVRIAISFNIGMKPK